MISTLITQQRLWLLIIIIYAGLVASKAAQEHDYIYDSKHYENVMQGMSREYRDIYYGQKCNSFDPSSGKPDPACSSVRTIDEGVMLFDITTPKPIVDHIVDEYNKVAYKFVVISTLKFYSFFLLLWLIPSIIFYPFFEWFLDGYNKDISGSRVLSGIQSNNGATVNKVESLLKRYFIFLEGKGKVFNLALGAAFSTLFGIFDIISPERYSFIMIYILPIALTTWFAGQSAGFMITIICIIFWSLTNQQSDLMAFSCNIFSTLCIYFVISIMLTKLRSMWEHETALSRTDQLTGVMNRRAFEEIVQYEIFSLQRQNSPFSLAYLDLDNFKKVNDNFGHKIGDELLKAVAECIRENIRRTDVIARMGGDEFTIFFPATDQNAIKQVMHKLQEQLITLNTMNNWPTTISIGVVTSVDSKCDLETSISLADKLMYEVKNTGKNDIDYMIIPLEL